MKAIEIEQEAVALPVAERIHLVHRLLDSLRALELDVSDEEVMRRERELDSGEVTEISEAEFVRRVEEERAR